MSRFFHKVLQKCPMKLVFLFYVVLFGNPCNLIISLKNKTTINLASLILRHGIESAILENLSTTKNMESFPYHVFGNPCLCPPMVQLVQVMVYIVLYYEFFLWKARIINTIEPISSCSSSSLTNNNSL